MNKLFNKENKMNKVKNILMIAGTVITAAKAIAEVVDEARREFDSLNGDKVPNPETRSLN